MHQPLPEAFVSSLRGVKGFDEEAFVRVHQEGNQVTSVRLNPSKRVMLTGSYTPESRVPWSSHGYYLSQRPSFTADPLFHAGAYYVQEPSSMFLEEVIRQSCDLSQPLRVLDLCAAPGGKSTLIQSLVSDDSLLVSNEVIRTRVNILTENLSKWGAANVIVTSNDPLDFQKLPSYFDLVVVDAPCSGSGLFRKDPGAITEWSPANVEHCSLRQQRILYDVMPALKPGGVLVYSTCSYAEQEDEDITDYLLSTHPISGIRIQLQDSWRVIETNSPVHNAYGYRFFPDKLEGEGFFIAAFRKAGNEHDQPGEFSRNKNQKNKPALLGKAALELITPYIRNAGLLSFPAWQEEILAIPASLLQDFVLIQNQFYLRKAGVRIGCIIRNELVPDHEFAMSNLVAGKVPSMEVDEHTALQYLRRQDIKLETTLKGWALIIYKNLALGWVKILPNRINNYYPKAWRILNK